MIHCEFTNPDDDVNITESKVQWFVKDQWSDAAEVYIGSRTGTWNHDWNWKGGSKFVVPGNDVVKISLRASFKMNAKEIACSDRTRRTHKSLPQPMKLKAILTTADNKTKTIEFEQINTEPLDLPTLESRRAVNAKENKEIVKFWTIDDLESDERVYLEILAKQESNGYEYVPVGMPDNKGKYVYNSDINPLVHAAKQTKPEEVPFPDLGYDNKGIKITTSILVDWTIEKAYALKFTAQSRTSSFTDYYLLPYIKNPSD